MLSPQQESSLTSRGDCFEHWHSEDRVLRHDDVLAYQSLTVVFDVSTNTVIDDRFDFIRVDTSAGNVDVTLPPAKSGRELEVMKNSAANRLRILPSNSDLILGATEVRVFNYGTSLRFKAVSDGWFII